MSLLYVDITKRRRPLIKTPDLPTVKKDFTPLKEVEKPTEEELIYSILVAINPLIGELVERLDLVEENTKQRLKIFELGDEITLPPGEPNIESLSLLAERIIKGEDSYSREVIVNKILHYPAPQSKPHRIAKDRAERCFTQMLEAGVIEQTLNPDLYYLGGSTPF